jgi:hypothetical protein
MMDAAAKPNRPKPKTRRRCRKLPRDATEEERMLALAQRVLPPDQLIPPATIRLSESPAESLSAFNEVFMGVPYHLKEGFIGAVALEADAEQWKTLLWSRIGMTLAMREPEFCRGPGRRSGGTSSDAAAIRKRRSRQKQDIDRIGKISREILELELEALEAFDSTPQLRLHEQKVAELKGLLERSGLVVDKVVLDFADEPQAAREVRGRVFLKTRLDRVHKHTAIRVDEEKRKHK